MSESEPKVDQSQPSTVQAAPVEPSPVVIAFRRARDWFMRNFNDALPHAPGGQVMVNVTKLAMDTELDSMRISALADLLVQKGIVTAEELCAATLPHLDTRIEEMNQAVVTNTMNRARIINGRSHG